MKKLSSVLRILTLVFSVGALALFFFNFATLVTGGNTVNASGAVLAFGSTVKVAGESVKMAKSADILCCLLLSLIGVICSALNFKFKASRYWQVGFTLASGIYMLVITLSNPYKFIDKRPLVDATAAYTPFVLVTMLVLMAAAAIGVAYTLVADYVECKGQLTLPKRIARFFREYKSEIKKIVWPGPKAVVKNTFVVLVVCAVIGAFVWLVDWGLGSLLDLILGL